jgi:hypothetical protein
VTSPLVGAVAVWCDPRRVKVLRDGGRAEWAVIPPLLARLQDALAPSGEAGGGGRGTGGSPVDLDALDILDGLAVTVADWTDIAGVARRPTIVSGLRQLAVHPWPPVEPGPLQFARILDRLAGRADAHLSPPDVADTRYVRDTACPECGERSAAAGLNGQGEAARVPVLAVELNRGLVRYVWCQACGKQWPRDQLEGWAAEAMT